MEFKTIDTGGIQFLDTLMGTQDWFWGTDYTSGDLYEAEELYQDGHEISRNRLIFVSYPDGKVFEPVKAEKGQYFGRPAVSGGEVFILLADFPADTIRILKCRADMSGADVCFEFPRSSVKDCYNLLLAAEPLTLIRQGHDSDFDIIWPDRDTFSIGVTETFSGRQGDRLVFTRWYEDPDYREETVVRRYPDGEILEVMDGNMTVMPDGSMWLIG